MVEWESSSFCRIDRTRATHFQHMTGTLPLTFPVASLRRLIEDDPPIPKLGNVPEPPHRSNWVPKNERYLATSVAIGPCLELSCRSNCRSFVATSIWLLIDPS